MQSIFPTSNMPRYELPPADCTEEVCIAAALNILALLALFKKDKDGYYEYTWETVTPPPEDSGLLLYQQGTSQTYFLVDSATNKMVLSFTDNWNFYNDFDMTQDSTKFECFLFHDDMVHMTEISVDLNVFRECYDIASHTYYTGKFVVTEFAKNPEDIKENPFTSVDADEELILVPRE